MTLVLDASVAAKLVLPEPDSDRAEALHMNGEPIIAPALVVAEIANAVWKRTVRSELTPEQATRAIRYAPGLFTFLAPMDELAIRAMEIAIELRHPIYDCFYLALAERERCAMVTADKRLLTAVKKFKGVEVRAL